MVPLADFGIHPLLRPASARHGNTVDTGRMAPSLP